MGQFSMKIIGPPGSVLGANQQLGTSTRRWVVERTLAWLNPNRRLAKDFEQTIASATAWLFIASVQLLTRRAANLCNHSG